MHKVCNFYILSDARPDGRFLFCCALIEKLYAHGHKVYVYAEQPHDIARFNELLWTYKEESFIPHSLLGEHSLDDCPIQIGSHQPPEIFQDVLILLSAVPIVPDFYKQFSRIIEIVDTDPKTKALLREHYQFYRSQEIEVKTHQI